MKAAAKITPTADIPSSSKEIISTARSSATARTLISARLPAATRMPPKTKRLTTEVFCK
jgi:hypothetical protein